MRNHASWHQLRVPVFELFASALPIAAGAFAARCAAWTIVRAARLPRLDERDEPQPLGFSRRGQLLDMITITV